MGLVKTEGIVTKEVKFGETSRIITLVTKDFGKISAIANNVRTGKSKLLSGLSLFSYSEFVLYESKKKKESLYRINEINVIEHFKSIRESIDKMAYASYFSDIINRTVAENNPDTELLRLLLNSLYILDNEMCVPNLLKTVFEIKVAHISGYAPIFEKCIKCGREEQHFYMDVSGGVLCDSCGKISGNVFPINNTVRELWKYIKMSPLKNAILVNAEKEVVDYLNNLTEKYLSYQLEFDFQTLKFLKNVMSVGEK